MISVSEALELITSKVSKRPIKKLPLESLTGQILAQDILSERDQPPFNRVMMDGVAIRYEKYLAGQRKFKIENIQRAGISQLTLKNSENCLEAMTGAVLPENTNAVIRYEDITIENGFAILNDDLEIDEYKNVHLQGSDCLEGSIVLQKGQRLHGPQIGIIASNGYRTCDSYSEPRIAIVSTGDELVDIDKPVNAYQIRKSNSYALGSELNTFGFKNYQYFHLLDDETEIFNQVKKILDISDILIFTGGVSAGKYDFLPRVFSDLKINKAFHKISQKPGKPLWFGNKDDKLIFGLPGNPVSALVCLRRYVIPSLQLSQNNNVTDKYITLGEDYSFRKDLTYFCPVKIVIDDNNNKVAIPISGNGSGDYGSLAYSDGFIELAKDENHFKKGRKFKFFSWSEC